jgi:NADPH2:quinone reductase
VKAALCREFGEPGQLRIEEIDAPQPGANQVLVEVHACGVNFPDVLMIAGKYQSQPPLPFVPGLEFSGDVSAVGSEVRDIVPGQRILAMADYGGMAEQAVVDAARCIPIPESMDYEVAAGFAITYGTSYYALKQRAELAAGETLLVLGAAGGVGLAAVELGKLMGARVIAAASNPEKLALAASYGASHLVNYSETDLKSAVRELTDGRGADVVYDPVGGEFTEQCLRCIAWGGRLLVVGFATGSIPKIAANLPLLKGSSVVGVFWGNFSEREPQVNQQNFSELLAHFTRGELKPHVSGLFPLQRASAAVQALADRQALGKLVVTT